MGDIIDLKNKWYCSVFLHFGRNEWPDHQRRCI